MRRLAVILPLAFLLAACGEEKDKEQAGKACPPAPAAATDPPKLPARFPTPHGVVYTGAKDAGPSTVVSGYRTGGIDSAFEAYRKAFGTAGYDVTKDEHEAVDAEVAFAGGKSTGQVKLLQTCKERTTVTITIRPA